jgi:hypothetical protein
MKNSEFLIAIVVILIAAAAIGGMVYYLRNLPVTSPTQTQPQTQPTSVLASETALVETVDSGGGHFNFNFTFTGINTIMMSLSSAQARSLSYGQNVEMLMTYQPQQRLLWESLGKVTSVSTNQATIALVDAATPSVVPISYSPKVGDSVVLSLDTESSVRLVMITGVVFSSSLPSSEFEIQTPSCFAGGNLPCVVKASSSIPVNMAVLCYWPSTCHTTMVTVTESGFSVSNLASGVSTTSYPPAKLNFILDTFTVNVPSADFVGVIHLQISESTS